MFTVPCEWGSRRKVSGARGVYVPAAAVAVETWKNLESEAVLQLRGAWSAEARQYHKGRCQMLVLSRKVGESIQISGDIKVTVTQVRGGRVRLSIEAPASVRIARKEILIKQQDETEKNSESDPSVLSENSL